MNDDLHPADKQAFDRAVSVNPIWDQMETAASALGMARNILLHAGPPFNEVNDIPKPVMNSACVAAVYEGLAIDFDQAEKMIQAEEIILMPAQDHAVVTPLAAVVGASMPLHRLIDGNHNTTRAYAPINGGSRPSLRLGLRSQAVVDHIKWLNDEFCEVLQNATGSQTGGMELIPLALQGLNQGDDCHGRTIGATDALIQELKNKYGITDKASVEFMSSSPGLFLNLWMAATKTIMSAANGIADSGFVTAIGGNGVHTGIQVAGLPDRWFTCVANAPIGRFDIDIAKNRALGAIGDSAVVEGLGLGAMAIHLSPEQKKNLGGFLPDNANQRFLVLTMGLHPRFQSLSLNVGVTARATAKLGFGPLIGLGIVDREGEHGRLGAGIYDMPAAPFAQAVAALDGTEFVMGGDDV